MTRMTRRGTNSGLGSGGVDLGRVGLTSTLFFRVFRGSTLGNRDQTIAVPARLSIPAAFRGAHPFLHWAGWGCRRTVLPPGWRS